MSDINSRDYWNHRFDTDWTTRRGCDQSRFFATVVLSLLPDWLVRVLRDGASVCDWGCALGDGTAVLATALAGARFTGIDFSATAIEKARQSHPGIPFVCRDLLQEPAGDGFDVVFSSNVLEHFQSPPQILTTLAGHARRLMVHLVPFREPLANREPEHHAAFDWTDVSLQPIPGWRLLHAAVADTGRMADSLWTGEQLLLVHGRDDEAVRLGLSLADVRIDSADAERHTQAMAANELLARIDALAAAHQAATEGTIRSLLAQIGTLTAQNQTESAATIQALTEVAQVRAELARLTGQEQVAQQQLAAAREQLRVAHHDLATIRNSRIWRWTSPLRRP